MIFERTLQAGLHLLLSLGAFRLCEDRPLDDDGAGSELDGFGRVFFHAVRPPPFTVFSQQFG